MHKWIIWLCMLAMASVAYAQNQEAGIHIVIDMEGGATIERDGWQREIPLQFGTLLKKGDLITLLDASAKVTVVCADLSKREISGVLLSSVRCPEQIPALLYKGSEIRPLRSAAKGNIPKALAPRATKLLTNRPTFRWEAVKGATSYTVALERVPSETMWRFQVPTNELSYPSGVALLEPGVLYTFQVTTVVKGVTYNSAEEKEPDLAFKVLSAKDAQAVGRDEVKIRDLGLREVPTAFVLANLYASNGLYMEAIESLNSVDKDGDNFAIQYTFGDLYVSIKLYGQAEFHFTNALGLARANKDPESQARAHVQIGKLFDLVRGNCDEAKIHFEHALDLYRQLGDENNIKEIEGMLEELEFSFSKGGSDEVLSLFHGILDFAGVSHNHGLLTRPNCNY